MEIYNSFAQVYDKFMQDVPYGEWVDYLGQIYSKYGHTPKLVLDLGCGTGNVTNIMARKGIDMIGIDISEDMLGIAKQKAYNDKLDILYLNQDMREFELYGTVDSVISICDSINYLLDEQDILQTFKLVNNYLDPGGLYIFDMNTEYKYREVLGDNNYTEVLDDSAYIWENYYDEDDRINEYSMTFFIETEDGFYRKYEENHFQKAYSIPCIKDLIQKAGLEFIDVFDAYTFTKPTEASERVFFVAKEVMKSTQV